MNIAPPLQPIPHQPFNPSLVTAKLQKTVDGSIEWLADGFRRDWEAHQFVGEKLAQGGSTGYRLLALGLNKLGLTGSGTRLRNFADNNEAGLKEIASLFIHFGEYIVGIVNAPLIAAGTAAKFYLGSASSDTAKETAKKALY